MTHPFHPWCGREFPLVSRGCTWGMDRVYVRDEHGQVISLPACWTSLWAADPFVVVGAGRSPFRATDLLELAQLVRRLQEGANQ